MFMTLDHGIRKKMLQRVEGKCMLPAKTTVMKTSVKMSSASGDNFIKVLRVAFMLADSESVKRY